MEIDELLSVMQLSSKDDMQTLDQALADLIKRNIVTIEEAMKKSSRPERLKRLLQFQADVSPL